MKILLVDDDARVANRRAIVLSTHGYDVHCVNTAAEAKQHCRNHAPDLVLVALDSRPAATFTLLRAVQAANPSQHIGFLLHSDRSLCAVSFNGKVVIAREGPDDMVERVAALLRGR